MSTNKTLVNIEKLSKLFPAGEGVFSRDDSYVHAVSEVDMEIKYGESVGLVGESGCGKTTTGKLITRLLDPTSGKIEMDTEEGVIDIASLRGRDLKKFRRRVQMIFQDPYESMNPRLTIYDTVAEPLDVQGFGSLAQKEERVANMLERVGLAPATSFLFRFPHELSGGQRQRVAVARALVINPELVVADEPTSMLDVSIRTGVMKLMQRLGEELEVAFLYITHDLAVARYMCDRIAVMYLGKIIEIGATEDVLHNPKHPYTKALLSAVPIPDPTFDRKAVEIKGGVSKPVDPLPICRFYDRCPLGDEYCETHDHPPLEEVGELHYSACYHSDQV